jgi:hypothetical protein
MMVPANRQDLASWLAGVNARKEPTVSRYLQEAMAEAFGKAQFVAAYDMTNLLSVPQVRARLRASASLSGKKADFDQLAQIMAGLRGVTFSVAAGDKLEGKLRVDFSDLTDPLKSYARDLILETLESQGVSLPEFRDWRTQVYGKSVHFEGRLSTDAMRLVSSFIAIPSGTLPTGKQLSENVPAAGPRAGTDSKSQGLAATKKYFGEVNALVNDLRDKSKSTQGYSLKFWTDRYALQIDRLPVLGVDDEVLEFGMYVSQTLRNIRNTKIETRANEKYARAANFDNSYYSDTLATATTLRRQGDAMMTVSITEIWTNLETKAAELRKKLSLKYQVEF